MVKRTACRVQCNCCDKHFWLLLNCLIKLLCCSCNVFYSCLRALKYNTLAVVRILQKNRIRTLCILRPSLSGHSFAKAIDVTGSVCVCVAPIPSHSTNGLSIITQCVKGVFIATQLNSTRRRVELCRYRRVSIATQLNSTDPWQLNSVQPSQSCFCLSSHDLQTESTGSLRLLIGDCWVELCRYKHPLRCTGFERCLNVRRHRTVTVMTCHHRRWRVIGIYQTIIDG